MGSTFTDYDVVKHVRARRLMVACWFLAVVFWGWAWYEDWQVALICMLSNAYLLFSLVWFWKLYPEKQS